MFTAERSVYAGKGYEIIVLRGAGHEVRLLPEGGFNAYCWIYEGREILMEPADISVFGSKYGIPILFPTPNRVKDAAYTWEGRRLEMSKRGAPLLRHGLVMDSPFAVTSLHADETGAVCEACIALREADGWFAGYPFDCTLTITYTLTADGLRMGIRVRNDGARTMPFGLAVHPYFSKRGDANDVYIRVPLRRVYETRADMIPTGRLLPAGAGQEIAEGFSSVESLYLDTVFRGMTADLHSTVRYHDIDVEISADDCFGNVVVYTPHDRAGFCIEPQTNATDFLNLHAHGQIAQSGLLTLPAGQTFETWINFAVARRETV